MFSLESLLIPISWFFLIAFGFGVIIGSFLNVYIYRFNTGKSLAGHSHCLSCGTRLRFYDLFPLFSYLFLRGRCRDCGCKIPARYFLVELATGLLFALSLTLSLDIVMIALLWFIFSVLVVITVYDLYHFIIPDRLTIILTLSVIALVAYEYFLFPSELDILLYRGLSALAGSAFFLALWVVSKGRWLGFGDVKLAFPLSLLAGTDYVFSFIVYSFWIGALISLLIIGWVKVSRGKPHLHLKGPALTMKSAVPFAPFLVASCLVILFTHYNVWEFFIFA